MQKEIKFDLEQRVTITELQRPGVVVGISIESRGIQYEVRYFDNSEARQVYFFEWELKSK